MLDGLIAQASPASARHIINKIGAACLDRVFFAKSAGEWTTAMTKSEYADFTFLHAFKRIFSSQYCVGPLQLSSLSTLVILEGSQSYISELHEIDTAGVGVVSRQQVVQALMNQTWRRQWRIKMITLILLSGGMLFVLKLLHPPSALLYGTLCKGFNLSVDGEVYCRGSGKGSTYQRLGDKTRRCSSTPTCQRNQSITERSLVRVFVCSSFSFGYIRLGGDTRCHMPVQHRYNGNSPMSTMTERLDDYPGQAHGRITSG
jgi:hypothetical protein